MNEIEDRAILLKEEFNKCSSFMDECFKKDPFPTKEYIAIANRSIAIMHTLYDSGFIPKEDLENYTLSEKPIYLIN